MTAAMHPVTIYVLKCIYSAGYAPDTDMYSLIHNVGPLIIVNILVCKACVYVTTFISQAVDRFFCCVCA